MPMPQQDNRLRDRASTNFVRGDGRVWTAGLHVSSACLTAVLVPPSEDEEVRVGALCWQLKDTRASNVVRAISGITRLLQQEVPSGDDLEVAVAVAGHVDPGGRTVTASPELRDDEGQHRDQVPLADLVEKSTGSRTRVVNDANALAVRDHAVGPARGIADFTSVFVNDYGVGCGIVANGQLVTGSNGSAGELGHIRVNGYRQPCRCGGQGCLERVASLSAITARIDNLGENDPEGSWAIDVHDNAGRSLGSALVALVTLLNPALIVVHGPAGLVTVSPDGTESVFINAVRTTVCSRSAFSDSGLRCRVVGQTFSPDYLAAGAATHARSRARV
ncbi:ROK family protein [Geodermatophilus sp. SYSU D00710]